MSELNEFQRRIGVGEPSRIMLRRRGTHRVSPVFRDDGPLRGTQGGTQTEHWDGRVDATVVPNPVEVQISKSTGVVTTKP